MVFKMALCLVLEKKMYLYFQLENTLRLFEIMKMIFKKCIRVVKETYNLTSTKDANFYFKTLIQIFL